MKKMKCGSLFTGKLPKGCIYCEKGAKMVLLVTGLCKRKCFYCPLSEKKRYNDVIYANEKKIEKINASIIEEARLIDALGTGITGGDPMLVKNRTLAIINLLKKKFGKKHHIHLYTAALFKKNYIDELSQAGLDEIRFHPSLSSWKKIERTDYFELLKKSIENIDTGIEIPAIPGYEKDAIHMIKEFDNIGGKFVNINELEYSETNYIELNRRGFTVKNDISSGVKGSEETALRIISSIGNVNLSIHYCSSSFKDRIQLRNRIMRRAKNVVKENELITKDGTILKGIILGEPEKLQSLYYNEKISAELIHYDGLKIDIAPWLAKKLGKKLRKKYGVKVFITEVYPTADALEVERMEV
ncbi:MAG: radical SAM protein [Candidatus Thermoplasmatota archaeon]